MPMFFQRFHFPAEAVPTLARLRTDLDRDLGPRAYDRLYFLTIKGEEAGIESMDFVAIVYFAKACQALGGVSAGGNRCPIPAWAEVPWCTHPWWRRLGIRSPGVMARWRYGRIDELLRES